MFKKEHPFLPHPHLTGTVLRVPDQRTGDVCGVPPAERPGPLPPQPERPASGLEARTPGVGDGSAAHSQTEVHTRWPQVRWLFHHRFTGEEPPRGPWADEDGLAAETWLSLTTQNTMRWDSHRKSRRQTVQQGNWTLAFRTPCTKIFQVKAVNGKTAQF